MGIFDHPYLFFRSISPPSICTRILENYREIGLTNEQLHKLLDLAKQYRTKYARTQEQIRKLAASLETALDKEKIDAGNAKDLATKRINLMIGLEHYYIDIEGKLPRILTKSQYGKLRELYRKERSTQTFRHPGLI